MPPIRLAALLALVTAVSGAGCSDVSKDPPDNVGLTGSGGEGEGDEGAGTGADGGGSSTDEGADSSGDGGAGDGESDGGGDSEPLDLPMPPAGCGVECDPWAGGTECGADEKCTLVACEGDADRHDAYACRPVLGDQKPGDPCVRENLDGHDDCEAGAVCWEVSPEDAMGYCVDFCGGASTAPTCAEGSACTEWGSNAVEMALCIPSCDPLVIDCPLETQVCVPRPDGTGFSCANGVNAGDGGFAEPCEFANACDAGLVCMDGNVVPGCTSESCCTPYCSLETEGNTCEGADEGQVCVPYFDGSNAPEGFSALGVCVLPEQIPAAP